jgi:glycosyltransferase involved in cell wall biosynthesis
MKKVTIITAIYNIIEDGRKEYFTQMFNSVQSQTYGNIEHLIIDGASKDGTIELIKKLKKSVKNHKVHLISEPDTGIYNALNKGIKNAQGDYIIFMNSDDYYCDEDAIKSLVKAIENNNADFSYSNNIILTDQNKYIDFESRIEKYYYTIPFNHQTMLCKKELFNEIGLFDEKYKLAADYKFMVQAIKANKKSKKVNKNLVLFRFTGASKKQEELSINESLLILKEIIYKNKFFNKDIVLSFRNNDYLKRKEFFRLLLNANNYEVRKLVYIVIKRNFTFDIKNFLKFRSIVKPIEKFIKKRKNKKLVHNKKEVKC